MNLQQLKSALKKAGISRYAYSLGKPGDEAYTLIQEENRWHFYYAERGHQWTIGWYDTEHEACEFFLEKVLSDPTTRQKKKD